MSFNIEGLPSELIIVILKNLPPTTLQESRLVSHKFNNLAFPIVFSHIPSWLDPKTSRRRIIAISERECRPSTMWSPSASEPEKDVDAIWLCIVYKMLSTKNSSVNVLEKKVEANESEVHQVHEARQDDEDQKEEASHLLLTPENLARLIGREELTAGRLKNAQNRYLLHRDYTNRVISALPYKRKRIWSYSTRKTDDGRVKVVETGYYGVCNYSF